MTRSPDMKDSQMREKILRTASSLFVEKGYSGTSVREIVLFAGATPPVLYYYFKSKEGLYLEIMQDAMGKLSTALDETHRCEGTAREKIECLALNLYRLQMQNIDAVRLIYACYYGPKEGSPSFDCSIFYKTLVSEVNNLLLAGRASGEFAFDDEIPTLWTLFGAMSHVWETELCMPEESLGEDGMRRVLAVFFKAISA